MAIGQGKDENHQRGQNPGDNRHPLQGRCSFFDRKAQDGKKSLPAVFRRRALDHVFCIRFFTHPFHFEHRYHFAGSFGHALFFNVRRNILGFYRSGCSQVGKFIGVEPDVMAGPADIDMYRMFGGRGQSFDHQVLAKGAFSFAVQGEIPRRNPKPIHEFFVEEFAGHGNGQEAAFTAGAAPENTLGRFFPEEVGLAGGALDHGT